MDNEPVLPRGDAAATVKGGQAGKWERSLGKLFPMPFLLVCACLSLTAGCRREVEERAGTVVPPQIQQEAQLNATVWRDELVAQQHERTMVRLADSLRRASLGQTVGGNSREEVLADFPFRNISIPRTRGEPTALPLGIQEQHFSDTERVTLTHVEWETAVKQFARAGWELVQVEWRHERFVPASGTNLASSEFEFELHGEQVAQTNQFIIAGTLVIAWEGTTSTNELPRARELMVRHLSLLERSGDPGFNNHLELAPEPDWPNGQVNVHPVIVTDINADGHDDIVLPGVNKVLLNDGHAKFETAAWVEERNFFALQNAGLAADFDGDGKPDFLGVAALGPMAKMVVLYRGDGALPWSAGPISAWEEQRRDFTSLKITHASVVTAGDVDGDGDLDVFIAQYRPPYIGGQLPTPYYDANDGFASYLLMNDGHGNFTQAKNQPALRAKGHRRTLSASLVDIDGDGDLDLVTLNDYSGVDLFYNDGKGTFTDETARLDNRTMFGMGLAFADFDRDGALDFLATGMSIPTIHRLESMNLAPKEFPDRTAHRAAMGYGNRLFTARGGKWIEPPWAGAIARTGWTWGVAAFDFDNNGAMDIYAANGHVSGASSEDYDSQCWTHDIYLGSSREDAELKRFFETRLEGLNSGKTSWAGYLHNPLFMDTGSNRYLNVAFLMGVAHESDCRAVVSADFNEDGRPDLVVTEAKWQGTPNIMRHRLLVHLNQTSTANHWIGVRLAGGPAIGAKVFVTTSHGTRIAPVVTGDSFQSQPPDALHFGLGEDSRIAEVRVVWPGGQTTTLPTPRPDRWHVVSH